MPDLNKPDPTEAVKEALTLAIKNLDDKLSQRFDANDTAVVLAREEVKIAAAELAKANSDALRTALAATTEGNNKLAHSFETVNEATNEKIDRLTERINIWTGRDSSAVDSKNDRTTDKGQTFSQVSILIAVAAVLIALATYLKH